MVYLRLFNSRILCFNWKISKFYFSSVSESTAFFCILLLRAVIKFLPATLIFRFFHFCQLTPGSSSVFMTLNLLSLGFSSFWYADVPRVTFLSFEGFISSLFRIRRGSEAIFLCEYDFVFVEVKRRFLFKDAEFSVADLNCSWDEPNMLFSNGGIMNFYRCIET